jgi:ferredoxin
MKVEFDEPRCDGFGFCEEVAPEVFRVDDDGKMWVLMDEVPAELEEKVADAARACPVAALKVAR